MGSQRAFAISIALVSGPKVMLMDEPFAGMNPEETNHLMDLTRKVCDSGITIISLEGEAGGLIDNEHVRKAYLGI